MGSGRVYTMFAAPVRFVEPLMFHLAMQHNAAAKAVKGAEKTSFAWVKGAPPFHAPAPTAPAPPHRPTPSHGTRPEPPPAPSMLLSLLHCCPLTLPPASPQRTHRGIHAL